jgi:type IV secretory pathway VirB3-like protein
MLPSLLTSLTTGEWIVAVGSGVLLILLIAPVVWLCWRYLQMSDDAFAQNVADVERFIELRDEARRVWH